MDEIVHEFLVESYENLDQLDQDFVALEKDPGSHELLSSIFRTVHTIKGTAGFLALTSLESVAHVGEGLLTELRDGVRLMDHETTDVLLALVDTLRDSLGAIEAGAPDSVNVEPTIIRIRAVLDTPPTGPASGDEQDEAPAAEAPVQDAPEADASTDEAEDESDASGEDTEDEASAEEAEAAAPAKKPAVKKPAVRKRAVKKPAVKKPAAPKTQAAAEELVEAIVEEATAAAEAEAAKPAAPKPAAKPAEKPAAPKTPAADAAKTPAAKPASKPTAKEEAAAAASRSAADSSIRVDVDLLDSLMRQVSELVIVRTQIDRLVEHQTDMNMVRSAQRLALIAGELQEGVMKTRMQPIEHVWSKMPRVVRDLANLVKKQVQLEMIGGDTELDRSLLEAVKDPLTHLVRNAVDHGIEDPAVRVAAGKDAKGTVTLRAYHASGQVVVEITDNGAGIDTEKVAAKAVEKGLKSMREVADMSPNEIAGLLFLPGFSTKEQVTNISGRGVGMDVVKTKVEAIGGSVDVESKLGVGTTWRMRIPLTLAIMPALTVECSGQVYALAQVNLKELVSTGNGESQIEHVGTAPVFRLRGQLLPLISLSQVLGVEPEENSGQVIAVVTADDQTFGLIVDKVLNMEEIVVKAISNRIKAVGIYSGATVLGDGAVALILDVMAIARRELTVEAAAIARENAAATQTFDHSIEQMLVVGAGEDRQVAIPLSAVTRLERIPAASFERVGQREVLQYRGSLLPVVRLDQMLGSMSGDYREEVEVVVYTRESKSVAMVVTAILDIVEDDHAYHSDIEDIGLVGSTVVKDRVTELLDVEAAVRSVDPDFYDDLVSYTDDYDAAGADDYAGVY